MKKLLWLVLLLCLSTGTAFAADWQRLEESELGDGGGFIDMASLQKDDEKAVVWQKYIYPDGKIALQQLVIKHKERKDALKAKYVFDANGKRKTIYEAKSEAALYFRDIYPESDGEILYTHFWPNEINTFPDRWYYLGINDRGNSFYVDNSTVQKDSAYAFVWTKSASPNGTWTIAHYFMRRKERTYTVPIAYSLVYPGKDGYIDAEGFPNDVELILPDSLEEKLYDAIW
ncbi:MAG: hypothetical protein LKE88_02855 [Acidaminococcus provencensis]|jgi:hypothetical protein|uniref:hypothetical protein n=1 Tax=Acidaminococcus TaxID=904 RepID=UPI000E4C194F|nr:MULTISPECIES: hypothetical protein [Acidaminococcus]MCH4095577.1 hypothetical protein [Acidaminococcus provencensis]RHK01150.1 hypothetical protein DW089_08070 [Acidaminococcus sp. AM05-11]